MPMTSGDILPDIVAGVCGAEAAVAMAGTVDSNDMKVVHMGQHHIKAGGIVEPTMQCYNGCGPWGAPLFGGEVQPVDVKGSFTDKSE